jgi:hypothetical protein
VDAYIISVEGSSQSCIYDCKEALKDELECFEFTEDEIKKIVSDIENTNEEESIECDNDKGYCIKIKKQYMSRYEVSILPEFNGW